MRIRSIRERHRAEVAEERTKEAERKAGQETDDNVREKARDRSGTPNLEVVK